jgi:hypothetical protein
MNIKQTFSDIYNSNYWGDSESVSGPGSTLYYTEEIRKSLSQIINELSIESMFDAPCGDFNWMQHVVNKDKINYVGGDIVPEIVISNQKKYQNQTFKEFNIIEDDFPAADLWICRDCFFHLPEADIIVNAIDWYPDEPRIIKKDMLSGIVTILFLYMTKIIVLSWLTK